jgi:hypothetical protein
MTQKKMLRRIFKKMGLQDGENYMMKSFIIYTIHQISFRQLNQGGRDRQYV